MLSHLRQFFASPVFADEKKTRLARLLNNTLRAFSACILLNIVLFRIFAPEITTAARLYGVAMLCCLALYWLLRRGTVRLVSLLLCLVIYVLIVCYVTASGGLRSPAISLFLILPVLAG